VLKVFKNSADLCLDIKKEENLIHFAYLSGNIIKRDIENVKRYIIYETLYSSKLSAELERKIKNVEIAAVMLYSENCAKTFITLCEQSGLRKYLKNMIAVVLSVDIKKIVEKYMDRVFYSKGSDNALMLDLICKIYE
jgi:uroporphyrinogen-III synthase